MPWFYFSKVVGCAFQEGLDTEFAAWGRELFLGFGMHIYIYINDEQAGLGGQRARSPTR